MPPEPILKSSRAQSAIVAVVAGLVLLGSMGVAYLQAGGKVPSSRSTRNPPVQPAFPSAQGLSLNYPKDWIRTQTKPDTTVLTDPNRPARQLRIILLQSRQPTPPEQMIEQCIQTQIDASVRQTLRQPYPRVVFTSNEFGFAGAEFLGISLLDGGPQPEGSYEQHLLACLSNDGINYWLLYLTDTTVPGEAIEQSMEKNATLLRAIYQSVRFADG